MRAIISGANGFIGKQLIQELTQRGYDIVALDVKFDELLRNNRRVHCINVDCKRIESLISEMPKNNYDCFFHLAWVGTSGPNRANYEIQLSNVMLACQFVELCKAVHCKRFLYASSINEMETYEYLQSDNTNPRGGYIYGTAKLAAHLMAEVVAKTNGIDFIPLIITNIFGVGEKSARMIYTSLVKLIKGEHCSFTAGYQMYDFIYISDAINSIVEVAEKGKGFNRYYIGSGNPRPLRDFLVIMKSIVDPKAELGFGDIPFEGIDISYNQFDLKKVEKDTGYVNQTSFEDGIRMTSEWIKKEIQNGTSI